MSFNWPDVPFSGTEVDAFVVEYKALAQTIYDTWYDEVGMDDHGAVSWEHLEPPYESRENVRLYLESALLYSAFVVKQRAGNSGPGTDFVLGSSPLNTSLPNPKLESLYKRLGCSFADAHLCYEEGDGTPPKFNNAPPPIEELANGGPGNAPPGQGDPGNAGNPPPPGPPYPPNEPNDECPGGSGHNGDDGSVNNGEGLTVPKQAWIVVMEILKGIAYVIGVAGLWHAADMVIHFLNGTGTTYTGPNRNMKNKLRIDAHNHLRNAGQPGGPKNSRMPDFIDTNTLDFIKGPYVELPAAARATLGLSPSQKAWRMDFTGSYMSGAFGRALIVSDGTETIDIHPFAPQGYDPNDSRWWIPRDSENRPNVNKITHILDDYDFNYSWSIVRSDIATDFPGIDTPDDIQIVSGSGFCGEDGNSNRTVCGALTSTGNRGKGYLQRLPVAEAHGDGCKDWDPNLSSRDGRPYTVRITF
tara:strand:- start:1957 stop:3369 length:1413 start_codon:yes stop_codon:yes gene_type:complete